MYLKITRGECFLLKAIMIVFIMKGFMPQLTYGQQDTVKNYKNTINFNITNPLLFNWKFNIIGYERVINNRQSLSVSIGRTSLGGFSYITDTLGLEDQTHDKGFHFSADYRFYLQKENKYHAPRGIYIGPYYAFNTFSRDLIWDMNTSTYSGQVTSGYNITANLIGCQLGYQFVFWDRLALDLVLMGPGLWNFNFKSHFSTGLSAADEELLLEQINELIKEKFPQSDFVFSGDGMKTSKTYSTSTMGLRYIINIGFRF
jgi:hypothetical protein